MMSTSKKEPLVNLVNEDKEELKLCHKLTKLHVQCARAQRQNVRMAAELLSHSVATAVRRMSVKPENTDRKDSLIATANFIDTVNSWFDVMNSYKKEDAYGCKLKQQIEDLRKMCELVQYMRCIGKSIWSLQLFQKGIIVSIKSLQSLFCDLRDKYDLSYILTHRLNQDCLENVFSQLRTLNAMYRIRMIILGKNPGIVQTNSNTVAQIKDEYLTTNIFKETNCSFNKINEIEQNEDMFLLSNSGSENIFDCGTSSFQGLSNSSIPKSPKVGNSNQASTSTPLINMLSPMKNASLPLKYISSPMKIISSPMTNILSPTKNTLSPMKNILSPMNNMSPIDETSSSRKNLLSSIDKENQSAITTSGSCELNEYTKKEE